MTLTWRMGSNVIRTDFAHPAEWDAIQGAIMEPQGREAFQPSVVFVDDRAYEDLTVRRLLEIVPEEAAFLVFLVDREALTHPDRPILVVNTWRRDGSTFRVIPSEMSSVENNLSQCNMDWRDFAGAVDAEGVYRGFGGSRRA
jgi:hypothetical protein